MTILESWTAKERYVLGKLLGSIFGLVLLFVWVAISLDMLDVIYFFMVLAIVGIPLWLFNLAIEVEDKEWREVTMVDERDQLLLLKSYRFLFYSLAVIGALIYVVLWIIDDSDIFPVLSQGIPPRVIANIIIVMVLLCHFLRNAVLLYFYKKD